MKRITKEAKVILKKIVRRYVELMNINGEALLKGQSYGWA